MRTFNIISSGRHLASLVAAAWLLTLAGCAGFQKIGPSEFAVVFSALPTWLGGGISSRILQPGEMEFLWPWEKLYAVDTSVQSISWGAPSQGEDAPVENYVETRAVDGNEVGLAMTILYHIDPQKVPYVVQYVGTDDERIRLLVEAVARSDIRTHMNILHTREFFSPDARQAAVEQVREALNVRLAREGIVVDAVIYNDHRFERRLPDGTSDRSYQQQIDTTQAINQEKEQEEKRIATVIEQKKREYNETLAKMNSLREEAEGFKRQSVLRGDSYLLAKQNEAEQVRAVGMSEVEGLRQQIAALQGPGGQALLRLAIVQQLIAADPKFVLLSGGGAPGKVGLDVNRLDTNALLREAGILSAIAAEADKTDVATPSVAQEEISQPLDDDVLPSVGRREEAKVPGASAVPSP